MSLIRLRVTCRRIYYLQRGAASPALPMASSLIWVLIGVYIGFFLFLHKVMKDA